MPVGRGALFRQQALAIRDEALEHKGKDICLHFDR